MVTFYFGTRSVCASARQPDFVNANLHSVKRLQLSNNFSNYSASEYHVLHQIC